MPLYKKKCPVCEGDTLFVSTFYERHPYGMGTAEEELIDDVKCDSGCDMDEVDWEQITGDWWPYDQDTV
jgi:hypothetical protein